MEYIKRGDFLIPKITLEEKLCFIGYYGNLRKAYLRNYRPILHNQLLLNECLYSHCAEINEAALRRMELILPQLAKSAGADEKLKASDQMKWVGLMNTCKAQAQEIIKAELIYV